MLRLLVPLAIAASCALAAEDVSGKWAGTNIVVTLSQHGQEVLGTVATGNDPNPAPIENAEVTGDSVTFEARGAKFRLTLKDGRMSGERSVGGQVSQVELSAAQTAGFYPIAGGVGSRPAVLIKQVPPQYTEEARAAGFQGTVVLRVDIDATGKVTSPIEVLRSHGLGLDEKAIEAVKNWKFQPATDNGTPVRSRAVVELNFR